MNSRCGEYYTNLNHYKLLKEDSYGTYAQVTITTDKQADSSPCESILVQWVQPVALTNEDIFNEAIYHVAYNADIIQETYFGGDNNYRYEI